MEPAGQMASPPATSGGEVGYSALPTDHDAYSMLLSPGAEMGTFLLPDGSPAVVARAVPEAGVLKTGMVATFTTLVGAGGDAAGSQASPAADSHCLVCNAPPPGESYALFDGSLFTTASRSPVLATLEQAVEAALDPQQAHSHIICSGCFELADRLDQLQEELRLARDAVRRLYWHTAGLYRRQAEQAVRRRARPPAAAAAAPSPVPSAAAVVETTSDADAGAPAASSAPPVTVPSVAGGGAGGSAAAGSGRPDAVLELETWTATERRRPQRAASQHEPGHYRSVAEGRPDLAAADARTPSRDDPADGACNELDISIHVEKAVKKRDKGDGRLACRYCAKIFQRPARLRQHEAAHTVDAVNQCHICNKTFSQKYYLREHIKQVHERRSLHGCDTCGKVFMRRLHLDDHVRTHSGERPYTCDVCGRGFTQRGNLRAHSLVHTGQFPYQCDTCGKRLRTRQAFEAHQRKHNDDRRFSCDVCAASFLLKRSLERHQRKHTGSRPFKCAHCDRAFRDRGDLRCHEGIHSAQRSHVCPLCGLGFMRRYKMLKHMRSKHDQSEEQVQELCLLQQTAHHMLQSQQEKLEEPEAAGPAAAAEPSAAGRPPVLVITGEEATPE